MDYQLKPKKCLVTVTDSILNFKNCLKVPFLNHPLCLIQFTAGIRTSITYRRQVLPVTHRPLVRSHSILHNFDFYSKKYDFLTRYLVKVNKTLPRQNQIKTFYLSFFSLIYFYCKYK